MQSRHLAILFLALAAAGCKPGADAAKDAKNAAKGPPLIVSAEDVATIRSNALASGPGDHGLDPAGARADLRAEVSAVVLQVLKENGDPVKRGDMLVRLDDTSIRDSLTVGRGAARAADAGLEQASASSSA